jgi:hypothetical protein
LKPVPEEGEDPDGYIPPEKFKLPEFKDQASMINRGALEAYR